MNRSVRWLLRVLLGVGLLVWVVGSGRLAELLCGLVLLVVLTVRTLRQRRGLTASVLLIILALPFIPIDLKLRSLPTGPRFIRCCPGAPYFGQRYDDAKANDRAAVCLFCSDLKFGFAVLPSWYLVL
jgi:hypothetical protein